jgi:hypothetical protein
MERRSTTKQNENYDTYGEHVSGFALVPREDELGTHVPHRAPQTLLVQIPCVLKGAKSVFEFLYGRRRLLLFLA